MSLILKYQGVSIFSSTLRLNYIFAENFCHSVCCYFRQKRWGFVYFVEIDGVITSQSILSVVTRAAISANINFQDPNGNNILLSTATTNTFRHRQFFQVHLTQPMKHVDIPGFLAALKPAWQTLRPCEIQISLFFDK